MGLFNSLKLGELKDKTKDLAQAGVAQSKRLAEIAKLKAANLSEEDAIKKAYIEIGKQYYAEKCAQPEEGYAAACEKITAAKAAIEANNARIAELKEPGDEAVAEEPAVEVVAEVEAVVADAPAEATAEDFADEEPKAE